MEYCLLFYAEQSKSPSSPPPAEDSIAEDIPIVPDTLKLCQLSHFESSSQFYVQLDQNKEDRNVRIAI